MNHCVPDFEMDEVYLLPASSSLTRPKKSAIGDEDIMELLWQNGQVVMQSQNQRPVGNKKPETMTSSAARDFRSGAVEEEPTPSNLFMQEDEMASWLHYPTEDNSLDLYLHSNDLLYPVLPASAAVATATTSLPPPPPPSITVPSPRPPIPPLKRVEDEPSQPKFANFLHFSRPNKGRIAGSAPSGSNGISQTVTRPTVVESNERPPAEAPESRVSRVTDSAAVASGTNVGYHRSMTGFGAAGTSSAGREPETCELSTTSSPVTGGSGASASVEPSSQKPPPATDDRKRKGRDTDDNECYSEDVEFEYHDTKKQSRGSTSTKRARAAEVHNLSERRRRDRINEKMKALQELIPRCNKSDKASMLDEAIEYLKSLQMQVQIMSMGYSMVPMMFPGVQRYMPPMAMGMGMGMDPAGVNRSMVPYPTVHPGSAAANIGQHFPVPRFQMAPAPATGPPTSQATNLPTGQAANLSDPMMNPFPPQNQNQHPYQQYIGLQQTQLPLPQNQTGMPPVASNPSSSTRNLEHHHHPNAKPSPFK